MSKFNTSSAGTKTVNLAGGEAFSQSPELELLSIMLTSFVNDQFYRSADGTLDRFRELINRCDPKFTAKAALYARTEFGMRSITHVAASELGHRMARQSWAKDFYEKIIYRPDDMLEIVSYHKSKGEKISNAMKKGFAAAFDKFGSYQLAKYRGEGKEVKMVDVVNLVHPVPTEDNAEALRKLMKGELSSTETWESKLTKAGQEAKNEEEKAELKANAWGDLLGSNKLGYFALLRNLRNILEQSPSALPMALEQLINPEKIKKSLVLPFRFATAYDEMLKLSGGSEVRDILKALNRAVDTSLANVPKFEGRTLVALDVSASMGGRPAEIAALFAAILVKSNNADLIMFESDARYVNVNPDDSTLTISKNLRFYGGGTNFRAIFQTAAHKYDRVIILSDMQGWIGYWSPQDTFEQYKRATGADPFVYSFDLQGYGTMQFPERNVFALAGFSDKIFDIMRFLEEDKQALINTINKIEL